MAPLPLPATRCLTADDEGVVQIPEGPLPGFEPFRYGGAWSRFRCNCQLNHQTRSAASTAPIPNPALTIRHDMYPSIIDTILGFCSNRALAAFRGTSKGWSDRLSASLLRHVHLKSYIGSNPEIGPRQRERYYLFALEAAGGQWVDGIPSRELALPAAQEYVRTIDLMGYSDRRGDSTPSILNTIHPIDLRPFDELTTLRRINSEQEFKTGPKVKTLVDFFFGSFGNVIPSGTHITNYIIYLSPMAKWGPRKYSTEFPHTLRDITVVLGGDYRHVASPSENRVCLHCPTCVHHIVRIAASVYIPVLNGAPFTVAGANGALCSSYLDSLVEDRRTDEEDTIRLIQNTIRAIWSCRVSEAQLDEMMSRVVFKTYEEWSSTPHGSLIHPLPEYLNLSEHGMDIRRRVRPVEG